MNSLTEPEVDKGLDDGPAAEPTILLENIAVRYLAPEERLGTFKEYAIRRLQQRVRFREFYALNDVSLAVRPGEIFGIIGRNGAGKSTLLKVVSRVLSPTAGRVYVRGRVSPLLELGAGFHPELTGRENIFLNGTLLGHTIRDLEAHMDAILGFAELGGFIDAPIRTYSSGMVARLGFSVATAWTPEILLMDEVMAVGDEAFRLKCQTRIQGFQRDRSTTLLVTHDMAAVETLCNRVAWLDHGKIISIGPASQVVHDYRSAVS